MNRLTSLAVDTRGGSVLKACILIAIIATVVLGPHRIVAGLRHAQAKWEDIWMMYRV